MIRDFLTFWSLPELIGTLIEDLPPMSHNTVAVLSIGVLAFGSFFF